MKEIITTISAKGFVTAKYDTAHFSFSFSESDTTSKGAKLKLKDGINLFSSTLRSLQDNGLVISDGSFEAGTDIQPHYVYNRNSGLNELKGQRATYYVNFQTQNLDLVDDVYSALGELPLNGMVMHKPSFSVRAQFDLKEQALKNALTTVEKLFASQCAALSASPSDFYIDSWDVNYDGDSAYAQSVNSARNSALISEIPFDNVTEFVSGKCKISVILTANYKCK